MKLISLFSLLLLTTGAFGQSGRNIIHCETYNDPNGTQYSVNRFTAILADKQISIQGEQGDGGSKFGNYRGVITDSQQYVHYELNHNPVLGDCALDVENQVLQGKVGKAQFSFHGPVKCILRHCFPSSGTENFICGPKN